MRRKKFFSLIVFGIIIFCGSALGDILNVPSQYGTIQEAIDDANNGDVIIIADGTYTGIGNKNLDFGGRAITVCSENGAEFTIIDCENDGRAFYFHSGENTNTVVEGLTITKGSAENGGGIYCVDNSSPTVRDCAFISNSAERDGGAMRLNDSSPAVTDCFFERNKAGNAGGSIAFGNSNTVLSECIFTENHCDNYSADGGAIVARGQISATIENCLFVNNKCDLRNGSGGAIRTYYSSPVITNCTFVGNRGYDAGAIGNAPDCDPIITNCILWGNDARRWGDEIRNDDNSHPTISFSNIRGGWNGSKVNNTGGSSVINGGGNINADPLFTIGPLGDYYLSQIIAGQVSDSPCVDTGSETALALGLNSYTTRTDHGGDDGIVDMGYHYQVARLQVVFDIKPGSCPNPFNLASKGVVPAAILGSAEFDVNEIDPASITLSGVGAIRSSYEDVAGLIEDGGDCECTMTGEPDGYLDLVVKFKTQEIVESLFNSGVELAKGQTLTLGLAGVLSDGTPIEGTDCIKLVGNVSKWLEAQQMDFDGDGIISFGDFAVMANYWLETSE